MSILKSDKLVIPPRLSGTRLDKALAELSGLPRAQLLRLWKQALVTTADGRHLKPAQSAVAGEQFIVTIPVAVPNVVTADNLKSLKIIFEDAAILVINKPAGLTVHPAAGTGTAATLADLIRAARPEVEAARYSDTPGDRARAGLVHRLDKETSGVMVIAKTAAALETLKESFKSRQVSKSYQAVCAGHPAPQTIDQPLGRHPYRWWLRAVIATGKPAQTVITPLKMGELYRQPASLVLAQPRTGRTHQIRVHLLHIGCPILGDSRYNTPASRELTRLANISRQQLHAAELTFPHPTTGKSVTFPAPLPADMAAISNLIKIV